jgi:hypothetical protein
VTSKSKCLNCLKFKDDFAVIPVEIVDKKTKEIIERLYTSELCLDCLNKVYKGRQLIRVYV